MSQDTLLNLPKPLIYKDSSTHHSQAWGCCELTCVKCSEQCPRGDASPPSVPGAAQTNSHDTSTNPNTRELQNISTSVTQIKDKCPMSMALLATCSFLKPHHLLSWSGVIWTMDSENIMPTLLSQSHKECARWGTPAKPEWHEDSAIEEASDAYWWLRNCCWPASSENLNGAEPQARLPGRSTGQKHNPALDLDLTRLPGFCMCTLMHLLCSRVLGESSLSV